MPKTPLAYVALVDAYSIAVSNRHMRQKDVLPLASAAAKRALAIDPTLAEAHSANASVAAMDWRWEEARQGFYIHECLQRLFQMVYEGVDPRQQQSLLDGGAGFREDLGENGENGEGSSIHGGFSLVPLHAHLFDHGGAAPAHPPQPIEHGHEHR